MKRDEPQGLRSAQRPLNYERPRRPIPWYVGVSSKLQIVAGCVSWFATIALMWTVCVFVIKFNGSPQATLLAVMLTWFVSFLGVQLVRFLTEWRSYVPAYFMSLFLTVLVPVCGAYALCAMNR